MAAEYETVTVWFPTADKVGGKPNDREDAVRLIGDGLVRDGFDVVEMVLVPTVVGV